MRCSCVIASTLTIMLVAAACGSPQQAEPTAPYVARFVYDVPPTSESVDVPLAILAPQFQGNTEYADYEVVQDMNRGLRNSFFELLVAKGFTVAGPYDSLNAMTFPEKRGVSFVVFPMIDAEASVLLSNQGARTRTSMFSGSETISTCTAAIEAEGVIQIRAVEPLSEQLMWTKRVDIREQSAAISVEGDACSGVGMTQEMMNEWQRIHEDIYNNVMRGLDNYVSAEEFQMLNQQAQELRENTRY